MKSTYTKPRKEILEKNIETVKAGAKEWNCSLEASLKDWINEGPMDQWLINALNDHFSKYSQPLLSLMKTQIKAETATYEDYKKLMETFIKSPYIKSKLSDVSFVDPVNESQQLRDSLDILTSLIANIEELHPGFEERFGQE